MPSPAENGVAAAEFGRRLAAHGLNLVGGVGSREFDRTQPCGRRARELSPGCDTVLVVGSGGSEFWRRMQPSLGGAPRTKHRGGCPIEARGRSICSDTVRWLADAGIAARAVFPAQRRTLNFVQLAEMAGLGMVSPVSGWLLHPEFGPWVSFGFALLVEGDPFTSPLPRPVADEFQPCAGCDQPCVKACPVDAGGQGAPFAFDRCATHRLGGGCRSGCEMRRACPCGTEHRYGIEEEALRHAASLCALQRYYGLGWWQVVPAWLRRRS